MKKVFILFSFSIFLTSTFIVPLHADALVGQKIFKKKLRKYCGFTGVYFSKKHTQKEWKTFSTESKFLEETITLCPNLPIEKINPQWWKDLYDFSFTYAKDGLTPKC